jgi:IMP dehydrogenase
MVREITNQTSSTFAEFILLPGLTTKNHTPDAISLRTPLSRYHKDEESGLYLNNPFVSAVMQAVSGPELGISLARQGGLSFIYCSQPIDTQKEMVQKVKEFKGGFVVSKANLTPENTLEDAIRIREEHGYSTVPITRDGENGSELLGILTDQDYWQGYDSVDRKIGEVMTPFENLLYGIDGISLTEAISIMRDGKKSCIPIINNDEERILKYLVFKKDRDMHKEYPFELVDSEKKLLIGAGINTRDYSERVSELVLAGANALVIDTSDGFNEWVYDTVKYVKDNFPHIPVGAGNVVEKNGFEYLAAAGADFIKVGIGGGSICITQEVKGIGRGQVTALLDVVKARNNHYRNTGEYIPLCSDGGLVQDSHILIALSLGADFVMMGRYFARCKESPTNDKYLPGVGRVKPYWGEGSDRARNWQRYHLGGKSQLTAEEGVDGFVPYAGSLHEVIGRSLGVIKSTMCNLGCMNISELHEDAILEKRSSGAMREGQPHDIRVSADSSGTYEKLQWG